MNGGYAIFATSGYRCSYTMTADSLAPQKEFESPTFRLGGGRSILLSYWGVCSDIVPKKSGSVNEKATHFLLALAYNGKIAAGGERRIWKKSGSMQMWMSISLQSRNGNPARSRIAGEA